MRLIVAMLMACGWTVFVIRTTGWFRRRKAEHRQRLIASGYVENNTGRRLRGDRYTRIAGIAHAVVFAVAYFLVYNLLPAQADLIAAVGLSWLAAAFVAACVAAVVWVVVTLYGEWKEPQGDVALGMRDKQFHPAARPVVPEGQYGTSGILDAVKSGLTDPAALAIPRRRIVEEVA